VHCDGLSIPKQGYTSQAIPVLLDGHASCIDHKSVLCEADANIPKLQKIKHSKVYSHVTGFSAKSTTGAIVHFHSMSRILE
jgi:hypothetical protein